MKVQNEYPICFLVFVICIIGGAIHPSFYKTSRKNCPPVTNTTTTHLTAHYATQPLRETPVLENAHAHNDYEKDQPLFNALDLGFKYIEVDVYKIEGELYVSHYYPLFLDKKKTLREMYLNPLAAIINNQSGQLYPRGHSLFLMIDIKTSANPTYEFLKEYLAPYMHFLTTYDYQEYCENAVTVFLSGNRPLEKLLFEKELFMFLDGRSTDLGKGIDSKVMPIVSRRYSEIFGHPFLNPLPAGYYWERFKKFAEEVQEEGKKIRMWGSPEDEVIWDNLLENGADIINTDDASKLSDYLLKKIDSFTLIKR